jgi:pyruvate dehydrogenase E1 component
VIKVLWGREWDELLAHDTEGVLVEKMNETLDGDWQRFAVETGAYVREHFFDADPRLAKLVAHLSDDQLVRLRRGGHDYRKIYAAYKVATETEGVPTAILVQTVKGWTLGGAVEGRNVTHQVKKLKLDELRAFRDRLELPIPDEKLDEAPYYRPAAGSPEIEYMLERRAALGGVMPARRDVPLPLHVGEQGLFDEFRRGTGEKVEASTTMAFVRLLRKLMKDGTLGPRVVPIVPDEARTFGMDPLFTEFKIYNPLGQRYTPVDAEFLISYREATDGQILEEGITEAGSMASATAAGTAYATHGEPMLPFFIFYSMFGFQRIADSIWAFGDARGRGFLLGATAGRTTLNGEGLQHQDGQSLLVASTVPSCRAYDPAFAYETAVIVEDGVRRMMAKGEDVFYYVTLYNEAYVMPPMPAGAEEGILRGIYLFRPAPQRLKHRATLLGSGPILREALAAQQLLAERFQVAADVCSVTSYGELRRDALAAERRSRLHPREPAVQPFVAEVLARTEGPIVAATDFVKAVPDMIARWVPRDRGWVALGTDGWGRSDTREALRRLFQVDAASIATAALAALAREGRVAGHVVERAIEEFGIDPDAKDPLNT